MSQEEARKPQEAIKYGDVFQVSGSLAEKPITPEDAAMMQSAESRVFGQTQKGGPASLMESAATKNEKAGLVAHRDLTDVVGNEGVMVIETQLPGNRIIIESVAGQVIEQSVEPTPMMHKQGGGEITIGEALEAAARTAGKKPVEQSDAAGIQAAEVRATGSSVIIPGGLSALAQSAAAHNQGIANDDDKIKLADVLTGAQPLVALARDDTRILLQWGL